MQPSFAGPTDILQQNPGLIQKRASKNAPNADAIGVLPFTAPAPEPAPSALGIITELPSLHTQEPDQQAENIISERAVGHARLSLTKLRDEAARLLPDERVARCGKIFKRGFDTTTACYNDKTSRARLTNLCACGSVHVCPRCAFERAKEDARELGWACSDPRFTPVMVTYTASHHAGDRLAEWGKKFRAACDDMKAGRWWSGLAKRFGIVHTVWSGEHTHAYRNGWHYHRHYIFYMSGQVEQAVFDALESELRKQYQVVLKRHGLTADEKHGVRVSAKEHDISEYIAKFGRMPKETTWDIESEVAFSSAKQGYGEHRTPFELLALSAQGDYRAGRLYVEYAQCVSGSHKLHWSRGAKDDLLHGDRPLPEAEPLPDMDAERSVVTLTREGFAVLVKFALIEKFLEAVVKATGDARKVNGWLRTRFNSDRVQTWLSSTYGTRRIVLVVGSDQRAAMAQVGAFIRDWNGSG